MSQDKVREILEECIRNYTGMPEMEAEILLKDDSSINQALSQISALNKIDERKLVKVLDEIVSEHLNLDSWPQGDGFKQLAKALLQRRSEWMSGEF